MVLSLVLAACDSSSGKSGTRGIPGNTGPIPNGGTLTIGAEEEPACFDWIGSCSGLQWGTWIAQIHTQPWAFIDVPDGKGGLKTIASPLLAAPATMTPTPVETISYKIEPKAVWSDGVQITCADFQYTVDQQQNGKDLYDPTGYPDIASVTCPTPKSVVVKYAKGKTYANWKSLFGAGVGIFPSHLLKGKDRDAELKNGYSWSGGPWFAKWTKGVSVVLTPNPKYWGQKPHLDKVVFKFEADTAAEFQAFQSGQVQAIYPQPQIDVVDAIKAGLTGAQHEYNANTASVEALWFNLTRPPFDSKPFRQALMYSIDRDAVVKKLFGGLGVDKAVNSLNPPVMAAYSDQNATSYYTLQPDKVTSLMTGAGWKKGSDGYWAKNGKRASFTVSTTADNKRRQLTEQIMQPLFKAQGFQMKIDNKSVDDLFGKLLPELNYESAIYGSGLVSLIPGLCSILCTSAIPTAANGSSGNNTQGVSIPRADKLMATVDESLNDAERRSAAKEVDKIMADEAVAMPIDPLPDVLIWSDKVVGPIQDNAILGMFWNLNEWGLKQ
ncbi:MAG: peptide/nickel transport system substrate-binding protein [Actinomycetota bacterium]|nr:peptide/nickel transport system substrate-binding protein [Actinomycetota bacterium]